MNKDIFQKANTRNNHCKANSSARILQCTHIANLEAPIEYMALLSARSLAMPQSISSAFVVNLTVFYILYNSQCINQSVSCQSVSIMETRR